MQISDCGNYLNEFFSIGSEIESFNDVEELVEKVEYFLDHDEERKKIALNGFMRVKKDYKIDTLLIKACDYIKKGMAQ